MNQVIKFPPPEMRPLRDIDLLYFKDRFVDNTPWELLVEYWGITYHATGRFGWNTKLECERQPVYPFYAKSKIRSYLRAVMV